MASWHGPGSTLRPQYSSLDSFHLNNASSGSVYLRDDEVDTEEVIDDVALQQVTPLPLPPPLTIHIAEVRLAARPAKVYETLFKRSSAFRARIYASEGAEGVRTSRWRPDPELAACTGFPDAKMRTITCMRPMRIPLPGALKKGQFRDVQALLSKSPGGFVLETSTTINAPGTWADFAAHRLQWACTAEGPHTCRLRLTLKVEIKQDTAAFVESTVRNTTVYHNKQRLNIWVDALVQELGAVQPQRSASAPAAGAPGLSPPGSPSPPTSSAGSTFSTLLSTLSAVLRSTASIPLALLSILASLASGVMRLGRAASTQPRTAAYVLLAAAGLYLALSFAMLAHSFGSLAIALTLTGGPFGRGQGHGWGQGQPFGAGMGLGAIGGVMGNSGAAKVTETAQDYYGAAAPVAGAGAGLGLKAAGGVGLGFGGLEDGAGDEVATAALEAVVQLTLAHLLQAVQQ